MKDLNTKSKCNNKVIIYCLNRLKNKILYMIKKIKLIVIEIKDFKLNE